MIAHATLLCQALGLTLQGRLVATLNKMYLADANIVKSRLMETHISYLTTIGGYIYKIK